ncbi:M23 family metallopeptidase [Microbacterium sp. C7(2022)]|uniref:M23 family metallopeptidase n=1 Tax=Microbacterium sp. C7(2022) TaxID=2992759 RepID=UPI00237AA54F|nr:M23 family metallopeptidase [Microbacterium sp. C7(2022)]MDE0546914.1 M23 family metallopeptidase [Microbacterium sp. C7(2022)]
MTRYPRRRKALVPPKLIAACVVVSVLLWMPHPVLAAPAAQSGTSGWRWPLESFTVAVAFEAPAHAYGPGHRGVDIIPHDPDAELIAPAGGTIAFRGVVVDRAVLTIDHGGGLVTTLEPIISTLEPGSTVRQGDPVGHVDGGGHSPAGAVHVGVRLHGTYINPATLVGSVPRAVLLPCC